MANENSNINKKAYITILKTKHNSKEITFPLQFNVSEYTEEIVNDFKEKILKSNKGKRLQFNYSAKSDFTIELFFDSTDEGTDVRDKLKPLDLLASMNKESHAPAPCMFVWGEFNFRGVVGKISKKYTYFYHNGIPARVRVNLTLKPYETIKENKAKTKKQSSDLTKQRITKSGDNIWLLADREYEDPRCWRDIAKANDIDDPRSVEMGRNLTLPPRREDG
jgi:hypothetical protein